MSENSQIFSKVTCSLTKKNLSLVLVLEYFSYTDYAIEKCQKKKS